MGADEVWDGGEVGGKGVGAMKDQIVDEEYEHGVPGRACRACNSAWPATEPDEEPWHHGNDCPVPQSGEEP